MRMVAGLLLAAVAASAWGVPAKKSSPAPAPPLDFSGYWKLDPGASSNVPPQMSEATLSVSQRGNRILISPGPDVKRGNILADVIVVDGRSYEKAMGPAGKGTVTANWAPDGKSLRLETRAGSEGDAHVAVQRSVWKISADRNVWVRESVSVSPGRTRRARLIFRRAPPPTPTPAPTPAFKPRKKS